MIQTIAPLQYFPISRVLPDPSDVTVYYVMAEVRNGTTGVLLASVKLLSQGSQIYSGQYRAPALASSQGLFLTITTRVYTDAAYSVASQLYGNDQDTFQIFDTTNNSIVMAQQIAAIVAGSIPDNAPADVDYKKIAKLFGKALEVIGPALAEEFKRVHARIDALDFKTDLNPVLEAVAGISTDLTPVIDAINKIDLKPLHEGLAALREAMPEDAPSLEPILGALKALEGLPEAYSAIKEVRSNVQNTLSLATGISQKHGEVLEAVKDVQKRQKKMPVLSMLQPDEEEPVNTFGRKVEKEK